MHYGAIERGARERAVLFSYPFDQGGDDGAGLRDDGETALCGIRAAKLALAAPRAIPDHVQGRSQECRTCASSRHHCSLSRTTFIALSFGSSGTWNPSYRQFVSFARWATP